ncbi:MAG: sulfatase-like hydrolase/transferase [Oscillospiraceae bacterium]|nr:sulfatase-like hydrolase/transferase [Oscillospiraceae bacterium]
MTALKLIIKNVVTALLLFSSLIIWFSAIWILNNFGLVTPEKLIFQMNVPLKGTDINFIKSYVLNCIVTSVLLLIFFMTIINVRWKNRLIIKVWLLSKSLSIPFSPHLFFKKFSVAVAGVFLTTGIVNFAISMDIKGFYNFTFNNSQFIKQNFVDTKNVKLEFPKEKRNLIYILLESMEVTYMSKEHGGAQPVNLIPELTELASDNISFCNSKLGGAYQLPGTGWTIAAMVSQTSGIPLRIPIGDNSYGRYGSFLPGAMTLGDILEDQGYNQTLMVGSDADFGGRKDLFTQHGNFKVLDYFTAIKDGVIPEGYKVWWGFEDNILYEYAKDELLNLSQQDKPFNFTLLTVDTHHVGGYVCSVCQQNQGYSFPSVLSCASRQVSNFIEWIKDQDFYDNTTVVIAGDHLSMETKFFEDLDENYIRTTYNAFLNSAITRGDQRSREFSTLDMFPTILASMGVAIDGDRLGLGTNLFSQQPTLLEKYGIDEVIEELNKSSRFYNNRFLHPN